MILIMKPAKVIILDFVASHTSGKYFSKHTESKVIFKE